MLVKGAPEKNGQFSANIFKCISVSENAWTASKISLRSVPGLILDLHPANERRRYKVTPSLIGWAQT